MEAVRCYDCGAWPERDHGDQTRCVTLDCHLRRMLGWLSISTWNMFMGDLASSYERNSEEVGLAGR